MFFLPPAFCLLQSHERDFVLPYLGCVSSRPRPAWKQPWNPCRKDPKAMNLALFMYIHPSDGVCVCVTSSPSQSCFYISLPSSASSPPRLTVCCRSGPFSRFAVVAKNISPPTGWSPFRAWFFFCSFLLLTLSRPIRTFSSSRARPGLACPLRWTLFSAFWCYLFSNHRSAHCRGHIPTWAGVAVSAGVFGGPRNTSEANHGFRRWFCAGDDSRSIFRASGSARSRAFVLIVCAPVTISWILWVYLCVFVCDDLVFG